MGPHNREGSCSSRSFFLPADLDKVRPRLEGGAHQLGRVDDVGLQHVDVLLLLWTSKARLRSTLSTGDDGAVLARVLGDLAHRRLQGSAHAARQDGLLLAL